MDIYLADERAFQLIPQFTLEVARDRLEQKKTNLVSGTLGSMFSRPKPEEIQFVSVENWSLFSSTQHLIVIAATRFR
jgi:hypothetical protein